MKNDEKRALVIGASEEAEFAIKTAQRRGYFVVAVDGNPEAKGFAFADKTIVADIKDGDRLKECLAGYEPQVVLPVPIGRYLTATGLINDYLGLKGVSEKSAMLCTDKYAYHQALQEDGLRDGECLLLEMGISRQEALEQCNEYLQRSEYENVIIKPRFGSGSRGVAMLSRDEDVSDYLVCPSTLDEDLILEPAYPGDEYGVDGMVRDGVLTLVLLREKIISEAPYRQAVAYIANHVDAGKREIARSYLQKIATLIGLRDCIIHCDLMWTGADFKVIEISARPSGHNLHNLFVPTVTGINMIDCFIDMCEGLDEDRLSATTSDKVFLIGYYDHQEGNLLSVPSAEAILEKFADEMVVCKMDMKPGFVERTKEGHGLMSRGHFVVRGDSREDVLNTREAVLSFVFEDFRS